MSVWSCALVNVIVDNRISVVMSSVAAIVGLNLILYRILILATLY